MSNWKERRERREEILEVADAMQKVELALADLEKMRESLGAASLGEMKEHFGAESTGRVADLLTPVPPGTRRVTIYQTGIGDIATPQWLLFNDPASPSLGQITIGANRRVVNLDRPGAAESISSGPADANAIRVITYIFSLEL